MITPPVNRHSIPFRHWSVKVARRDPGADAAPDTFGHIVTALDDIEQAIFNLILTPKGSVPTEPLKGVDWAGVVDRHPDIGIPLLSREIWDQLAIWETRIVVDRVEIAQGAFSRFTVRIAWRPVESVLDDLRVTEVSFDG